MSTRSAIVAKSRIGSSSSELANPAVCAASNARSDIAACQSALGLLAVLFSGMAIADRRERELAQRRARIVTAARTLAETEGWDAVTTRRLADSIEYSQPVLYS